MLKSLSIFASRSEELQRLIHGEFQHDFWQFAFPSLSLLKNAWILLSLSVCKNRLRGSRDPSAARPRIRGPLCTGIRDRATASGQVQEQEPPSSSCTRTRSPRVALMIRKPVESSLIYCSLFTTLCSAQKPAVQNREINGNSLLRLFF